MYDRPKTSKSLVMIDSNFEKTQTSPQVSALTLLCTSLRAAGGGEEPSN
jgi:hypothetical protein